MNTLAQFKKFKIKKCHKTLKFRGPILRANKALRITFFEQKTISEQIDLILAHCAVGASNKFTMFHFSIYV